MGKTVIFGGTFDPFHNGHLEMAKAASKVCDWIMIVPDNVPPHKEQKSAVTTLQRYEMCALASDEIEKSVVSDYEISKDGKSYSVDTLEYFKKMMPDEKLFLLIGGDMLGCFDKWKDYEKILSLCTVLAVKRKGESSAEFDNMKNKIEEKGGKIVVLDADIPDVSSKEIREKYKRNESPVGLMPYAVSDYIEKNGLYK